MIGADGTPIIMDDDDDDNDNEATPDVSTSTSSKDKGKGVDRPSSPSDPTLAARAFYTKFQTSLSGTSTQLSSLIQTNLTTLRTSSTPLSSALSLSPAQRELASEYLHKGETFLAVFKDEVGRLAREAVVVVPGSEGEFFGEEEKGGKGGKKKGGVKGQRGREREKEGRKAVLIRALRGDLETLRIDPGKKEDEEERNAWSTFLGEWSLEKGGLEGERLREESGTELDEDEREGGALRVSLGKLVLAEGGKGEMDGETFWMRYFWAKELILREEEKRKRVLEGQSKFGRFSPFPALGFFSSLVVADHDLYPFRSRGRGRRRFHLGPRRRRRARIRHCRRRRHWPRSRSYYAVASSARSPSSSRRRRRRLDPPRLQVL